MEEASDAWSLLEEQVPLPEDPSVCPVTEWAVPPPRAWCVWRDLGRLAKRPSAIILNSVRETSFFFFLPRWL